MGEHDEGTGRDGTDNAKANPAETRLVGASASASGNPVADGADAQPADSDSMAIDNPAGAARPRYNQYALNDPSSMDKRDDGESDRGAGFAVSGE